MVYYYVHSFVLVVVGQGGLAWAACGSLLHMYEQALAAQAAPESSLMIGGLTFAPEVSTSFFGSISLLIASESAT